MLETEGARILREVHRMHDRLTGDLTDPDGLYRALRKATDTRPIIALVIVDVTRFC
jgi:shikimate 5-dehydrogenase